MADERRLISLQRLAKDTMRLQVENSAIELAVRLRTGLIQSGILE